MLTNPNYPNIAYDPDTGAVYRSYKTSDFLRRILPDEQYFLYANDTRGRLFRRKAHVMLWMIAHGEIPEGLHVIQCKGNDLRLCNLKLVDTLEYTKYNDAKYNLNSITIKKEARKYTYYLRYMRDGKLVSVRKLEYDNALKLRSYLAGEAREYLDKYLQ